MSTITMPAPRRVLADVVPRSVLADVALVVGAAAFVGALAQISIHLGNNPVPVTGQTLGVMLAGTALGWRRAGMAMALYLVAGVAGVPWFATHSSGYVLATFGYLIGFVVAGSVLGWLASRGTDRTVTRAVVSMAVGDVIIFIIGVTWLKFAIHVSPSQAIAFGFTPFVSGEVIKAAISGVALPSSWRLVDRVTRKES
ncbi:MAG TPA: biotin transporter BioY [Acidimicrobiales bacterium]|nr:biotin transporter BioY [Acidimicrobiales bacterium]